MDTRIDKSYYDTLRRQEKEMPRLPVPDLHDTMNRFLKSTKPFLTNNEYDNTKLISYKFFNNENVKQVQKLLEEKAKVQTNWLKEYWLNWAYLDSREPLMNFSSTTTFFPQSIKIPNDMNYLKFTSIIITAMMDFKTKLFDLNEIPITKIGTKETCALNFKNVFASCRIPQKQRDFLRQDKILSTHILVHRKNNMFMVPVYDKNGGLLTQNQILKQLEYIVENSEEYSKTPIGILTTGNRDDWAETRIKLINDCNKNAENINIIETALFSISLDRSLSTKELEMADRATNIGHRLLHGGYFDINEAANRYYDICCQFAVTESCEGGFIWEHGPIDGPVEFLNHVTKYWTTFKDKENKNTVTTPIEHPVKLSFQLSNDVQADITKAFSNIYNISSKVDANVSHYTGFGRNTLRKLEIRTVDSFIQIAIQLAFYKLHGVPTGQYETASTKLFLHARTETIRSCCMEVVNFIRVMMDGISSEQEKGKALKSAMTEHKKLILDAMTGKGIDRHLLGLKLIAIDNNIDIPIEFYNNPGYLRSSYMRLSTSQVSVQFDGFCTMYAPLVPDGYGCCYNVSDESITFGITSYTVCKDTNVIKFSQILTQSLNDMKDLAANILPYNKL